MADIKKPVKKKVLFYFGSYKHPFYDSLTNLSLDGFEYISSRIEEAGAHVASQSGGVATYFKQNILLNFLKCIGVPKIMPLTTDVDIVHSAQYLLRCNKPYVVDFEDVTVFTWYDFRVLRLPWTKFLIKRCLADKNCKAILPWTEAARASLVNSINLSESVVSKIKVLYPCCPAKKLVNRTGHKSLSLLFIGKKFYEKGGLETILAFVELQKTHPTLKLHMVSEIPAEIRVRFSAVKNLFFYTRVEDKKLESLFMQSDIFVMPSHYDTFGFVYLQAMSYGLPCIGTNHFATPEIVTHGKTGLLVSNSVSRFDFRFVPVGNFVGSGSAKIVADCKKPSAENVKELADALLLLIGDSNIRRKMGLAAYSEIATGRFSLSKRSMIINELFK